MTTVVQGGKLTSNKGINIPGAKLKVPAMTEKDRHDLAFGRKIWRDFFDRGHLHQRTHERRVDGTPIEAAWPAAKAGIVLDGQTAPGGWSVKRADEWTLPELVHVITATTAEEH